MSQRRLLNKTIEWEGWWFDIEPRLIRVRPAPGGYARVGGDMEFHTDYINDRLTIRFIRAVMAAVNAGAVIRGRQIRGCLGVEDGKWNRADLVFGGSEFMYWVEPGPHGYARAGRVCDA